MLPARNLSQNDPGLPATVAPSSSLPPLPNLAGSSGGNEEPTVVVATPSIGPRRTTSRPPAPASGVRALTPRISPARPAPTTGGKVAAKGSRPPPLPLRKAAAEPATTPMRPLPLSSIAEASVVAGVDSVAEDANLAIERMFPVHPRVRAFRLVTASVLFIAYASAAAFRWALRAWPAMTARALASTRALGMQGRDRLRLEWRRAADASRTKGLRDRKV